MVMWSMYEMTCGYLWWNDAFCEFKLINVKRLCAFDFSLDGCGQLDRFFEHRRERPTEAIYRFISRDTCCYHYANMRHVPLLR